MSGDTALDLHHPGADELQLSDVLQALADPLRLQIVSRLDEAPGELACGQFPLPVGKSTVSHHFKVLREAGIVAARYDGTRRLHRLRRNDLDTRFPGLLDSILQATRS